MNINYLFFLMFLFFSNIFYLQAMEGNFLPVDYSSMDPQEFDRLLQAELAAVDNESCTDFSLPKQSDKLSTFDKFDELRQSYETFLKAFHKQFSSNLVTRLSQEGNWLLDERLMKNSREFWQKNHVSPEKLKTLETIAQQNNVLLEISSPYIIHHLLEKVAYSPIISVWKEFNCIATTDVSIKESLPKFNDVFYSIYPKLTDRADFAFSLLHFYEFSLSANSVEILDILSNDKFLNNVKILENSDVTLASYINTIKHKTIMHVPLAQEKIKQILFSGKQSKANSFIDLLTSIKIAGYSSGVWGYGEWSDQILNQILESLKGQLKNPGIIEFKLFPYDIKLSLAELRLINGKKYLGHDVKEDIIFRNLLNRFFAVNTFSKYLALIKQFPLVPYIMAPDGKTNFAEQLLMKFIDCNPRERNKIELEIARYDGDSASYHMDLWRSLQEKAAIQDSYLTNINKAFKGNRLHLKFEELEILNQLEAITNEFTESTVERNNKINPRAPKKSKGKGKKGTGKKGKKNVKQTKNEIPVPIAYSQASNKKPNKKKNDINQVEVDLKEFYPHLYEESQILFVPDPVTLLEDKEIFEQQLLEILRFRKTNEEELLKSENVTPINETNEEVKESFPTADKPITILRRPQTINPNSVEDAAPPQVKIPKSSSSKFVPLKRPQADIPKINREEENEISLFNDKFSSALQRMPGLNPKSTGYLEVLKKLLDTQQKLAQRSKYITNISYVLNKMRIANIRAHNNYQFALSGFIRLYSDCHHWLIKHSDENKRKILIESWANLKLNQGIFSLDWAQGIFLQQIFASNQRCAQLSGMLQTCDKAIYPCCVNDLYAQESNFEEETGLNAQREISSNTFEIEKKTLLIQAQVKRLLQEFPDVI